MKKVILVSTGQRNARNRARLLNGEHLITPNHRDGSEGKCNLDRDFAFRV